MIKYVHWSPLVVLFIFWSDKTKIIEAENSIGRRKKFLSISFVTLDRIDEKNDGTKNQDFK